LSLSESLPDIMTSPLRQNDCLLITNM
jgi:hypothetical protein